MFLATRSVLVKVGLGFCEGDDKANRPDLVGWQGPLGHARNDAKQSNDAELGLYLRDKHVVSQSLRPECWQNELRAWLFASELFAVINNSSA
jgi:hypothetical protein